MMLFIAAALGVALFVWTIASVGVTTLIAQVNQLGLMVPLVLALAAVRFVMQAAGWRIAMGPAPRPTLLEATRAVIAGEAAGYLTWGPISREPVKAMMVSGDTPERISLPAAIAERVAYAAAASGLIALSLILLAIRTHRTEWIAPGIAAAVVIAAIWRVKRPRLATGATAISALAALAILQEIINVLEAYAVLTWLGAAPTVETSIALEGLNRLANAPAQLIPGKLGVLELAGSTFASVLQLGNASGVTLVLARRVRSLAWTGVGILLLTSSASRARDRRRKPALV